jgi:hypothetical protein
MLYRLMLQEPSRLLTKLWRLRKNARLNARQWIASSKIPCASKNLQGVFPKLLHRILWRQARVAGNFDLFEGLWTNLVFVQPLVLQ